MKEPVNGLTILKWQNKSDKYIDYNIKTCPQCQKFKDTWYEVAIAGSVFWPAANMVNFMYCPPAHRVLFLNGGGLFWNAFLSWQNAKSNAKNTKGNELRVLGPSVVGLDGALGSNLDSASSALDCASRQHQLQKKTR